MNAPDAPGTLQRPIRASRLRDLSTTEQALMDTRPATDSRIEQLGWPAGQAEPAPSLGAPRFKLRRWPPTVLLQGRSGAHPYGKPAVTACALSTTELARISGRWNEKPAFLQLLQTTGLVNLHQEPPRQRSSCVGTSARRPRIRGVSAVGLIAGIRRRLGGLTGGTHTP